MIIWVLDAHKSKRQWHCHHLESSLWQQQQNRKCIERGQITVNRVCTGEQKVDSPTEALPSGSSVVMNRICSG
ncbi:hypothetical protein Zm00014a_029000 [Zea mays]|uniref:Uncharacterized protein n=1 Tax=Zea mays TaxID=4577 RepID=A0A3L6G688_MAIZE|nr:hypothetical protein Zm00014a_029000 [Zea mays]